MLGKGEMQTAQLSLTTPPYKELRLAEFQGHGGNAEKQQAAPDLLSVELCYWYCSANLLNGYN